MSAAFISLVLLVCVMVVWIVPAFDDGDSGTRPGFATPVPFNQPTPTP